ncbi:MAG: cation-transporting P-type ATPase [Planctomycetota bacterium]
MADPESRPWVQPTDDVLAELEVRPGDGLTAAEARDRLRRHGPNRLRQKPRKSTWTVLANQFKSFIILLLAVASLISFLFGQWIDGVAIGAAIALNTIIGFVTELRAVRSMESIARLGGPTAKVRREGEVIEVPAERLVPGDVVLLEGGDLVPADLRLVEASKLQADESALTGESVPAGKTTDPVPDPETPLAERSSMVFRGTAVVRGSGEGVVTGTGMDTEVGRIASLAEGSEEEITPLEQRLNKLGRRLVWLTLGLVAVVGGLGVAAGKEIYLMVETAIALAVAAVPEGLPIVATIALARGMWRMARRNALVNRLSAVETLGSTNVLCIDKTGTLTENQMTVTRLALPGRTIEIEGDFRDGSARFRADGEAVDPGADDRLHEALTVGVLCSNAEIRDDEGGVAEVLGDPLEAALAVAGLKGGLHRDEMLEEFPESREVAFDPEVRMMATFHETDGGHLVAVKGAPDAVLEHCDRVRTAEGARGWEPGEPDEWLERNERLAEDGLRVLALARKEVSDPGQDPYEQLVFVGLAGFLDPVRSDVREPIDRCQAAGIRVVMATGDQAATARNVALAAGLVDDPAVPVVASRELRAAEGPEEERRRFLDAPIFARISPEQKLDLIAMHQGAGSVVAMTGDGVNDAPALKKADIGVAMGERGTQVAQEAADVVLKDDALSTIVTAVELGRDIFLNIRRFVLYLLSGNVSEIIAVAAASVAGLPLPILPLQILFLNLVNDVFPALALGVGEGPPDIMSRPPRSKEEPVLRGDHWLAIGGYGVVIAATALAALLLALNRLGLEPDRAVTVSFLTLGFGRLWHVFNMRERGSPLFRNDVVRNPYVWAALGLCTCLLLAAVYAPGLSTALKTRPPGADGWALALGLSLFPCIAGQVWKTIHVRERT